MHRNISNHRYRIDGPAVQTTDHPHSEVDPKSLSFPPQQPLLQEEPGQRALENQIRKSQTLLKVLRIRDIRKVSSTQFEPGVLQHVTQSSICPPKPALQIY